jgi:hypothetical protein
MFPPTPVILPDAAVGGKCVLRQIDMFDLVSGWALASTASEDKLAVL